MRGVIGLLVIAMVLGPSVDAGDIQAPEIWIVSGSGAGSIGAFDALEVPVHHYPHLDMAAILATPRIAEALAAQGWRVDRNEAYPLHLDTSVALIEADRVKEAVGTTRTGPTVLVIDTGIDSQHPDFGRGNLAANVAASRSPNGLIAGYIDDAPVTDRAGHGTHVAGIVAGSGDAFGANDPQRGKYQGVYSNGRVASFQASNNPPPGQEVAVELQAALEGFEWALAHQDEFKLRVISNSWGSKGDVDLEHPAAQASLRAYAAGMVVIFSAGNEGEEGTLNRHCMVPWALCVAAGTDAKTLASFSSMGNPPESSLGPYDHPDVTAPGADIRSADPFLRDPAGALTGQRDAIYVDRSGTSMAAPHVAGVAGLLSAANPKLSPDQVMDIIVGTTDPMADPVHKVGTGFINARAAYNLAIRTLGEREQFLAGEGVKYAGEATGDAELAADPVTVGYDAQSGGTLDAAILAGPEIKPWILTSPLAWALGGVAVLMALIGIRFRQAPAQEPAGDAARDA